MLNDIPFPYIAAALILMVIWAGAYIIGLVKGTPRDNRTRRLARPAKVVMIFVTLSLGGLWWQFSAGTGYKGFAQLVFIGLLFGGIGDLALAGIFTLPHTTGIGILLFSIGHGFYIAANVTQPTISDGVGGLSLLWAILLGAVVGAAGWWFIVYNRDGKRLLNIGSMLYGMLLCATVAIALHTALITGITLLFTVGLSLFAVSDFLLAQALIRHRTFTGQRDIVWIIYSTGQMMIALTIGVVAAV